MTVIMEPSVILTEAAAAKILELIDDEGNEALSLRVFITGGGCSGLKYNVVFDDVIKDDDHIVKKDSVKLLIDMYSYPYLAGATIDYKDDVQGARFVIRNPNAKTSCGCGSSFATDE